MIHTLVKNGGFEGILFPGDGSKDKVVIVMSGSNGGMSMASACLMEDKLKSASFPYRHKHIVFENISHAAVVQIPWIYRMAFKSERQHPKECSRDRKRMKTELLKWVNNVWQR